MSRFTLIILVQSKRSVVPLNDGTYVLGRGMKSDIPLGDPRISSRHAILKVDGDDVTITDLGSTNGTFVNGEKLPANMTQTVSEKTVIEIGPVQLQVETVVEKGDAQQEDAPSEKPAEPSERLVVSPPKPPPPLSNGFHAADGWPPDLLPLLGLSTYSKRLISYLPEIYQIGGLNGSNGAQQNGQTPAVEVQNGRPPVDLARDPNDFTARFLGLFEAMLFPTEWTVDNFDLFLSPTTAPSEFLSWLGRWYAIVFDPSWEDGEKREFLRNAHEIYAMRGTKWALERILEIYIGVQPDIRDLEDKSPRHQFTVILPVTRSEIDLSMVRALIDQHKPAHTTYRLRVKKG